MALKLQTLIDRPETVLYCFASDQFISQLGNKAIAIISYKKAKQKKLLNTLAVDAGMDYASASNKIQNAFKETYGMYPADALKVLASGGEVAGKNWSEGVYGIGAVKRQDFAQNSAVTVDQNTGKILVNGSEASGQTAIYAGSKVKSYTYADAAGNTFTSVRKLGKYYANTYTASGSESTQNANGDAVTSADSSSIWTSISELFCNFINWLIGLFTKEEESVVSSSTLASQSDGFVEQESSMSEAAMWAVLAVGAGIMLSGGLKPKRGNK